MSMGVQVGFHPLQFFFPPKSVLSTRRTFVDAWYVLNTVPTSGDGFPQI
jgi:hypothetical protein